MTQSAPHPRMHGLTHVAGGPDPVPGLLPPPGGTVEEIILGTLPGAYYKLNETTGGWADSSGGGRDAVYTGRGTRGIDAPLDENDGALCAHVAGTVPVPGGAAAAAVGVATDPLFEFAGAAPFTVSALIQPDIVPADHSDRSMGICGNVVVGASSNGWGLYILSHLFDPDFSDVPYGGEPARVCFRRKMGGTAQNATGPPLAAGEWVRVTGVFDGTTVGLWLNSSQVGGAASPAVSLPAGSAQRNFRIGDCGIGEGAGGNQAPFNGQIDSVIVWDRALTIDEIERIVGSDPTDPSGVAGGDVLTSDGHGGTEWAPPTIEVVHGGGVPDQTPLSGDSSVYAGTPTSPSGWHLQAHTETVVLYDANPARFDVPPRQWVRVPFDTVRIWRRWEPVVGGPNFKEAWLPDDRGLADQARKGILHVNAAMTFDPLTSGDGIPLFGWFSIEWPVLDPARLPNEPATGLDAYVRAGRYKNLSTGSVIRAEIGSSLRRFFEWQMPDTADGTPEWVDYSSDNPYPIYPVWAARPLRLPDPYPQLADALSHEFYAPRKTFGMNLRVSNGDNLCMEVWQDSPWLLRFSTDTFEAGLATIPAYTHRPYLALTYGYDPETIDHDSGELI